MDKRKQAGSDTDNQNKPKKSSSDKTPNRSDHQDDMRQAKMDEEKDEQDLEEDQLSDEEADKTEWDPQSEKNTRSGL